MVVTSHIEGRVRIRDEGLKKETLLLQLREALLESPGISGVEANPRVGSLLVIYNAASTGVERIQQIIAGFIGEGEAAASAVSEGISRIIGKIPRTVPPRVKRIAVNAGMLASLVLSVVAAVLDLKTLHILAGVIFLAIFGAHLYERRQYLFA